MMKSMLNEAVVASRLWHEDCLKSSGTTSGDSSSYLDVTIELVLAKKKKAIEVYLSIYDRSQDEYFYKDYRIGVVPLKEHWKLMDFLLYVHEWFIDCVPEDSPENLREHVESEMELMRSNSPLAPHYGDVYLAAAKLQLYHFTSCTPDLEAYVPFECTQVHRVKFDIPPTYAYFLRTVLKSLQFKDFTGWPTSLSDHSLGFILSF